jgi:hypothetical protein
LLTTPSSPLSASNEFDEESVTFSGDDINDCSRNSRPVMLTAVPKQQITCHLPLSNSWCVVILFIAARQQAVFSIQTVRSTRPVR